MAAIQRVVVLNQRRPRSHLLSYFRPLDTMSKQFPLVVIDAILSILFHVVFDLKRTPLSFVTTSFNIIFLIHLLFALILNIGLSASIIKKIGSKEGTMQSLPFCKDPMVSQSFSVCLMHVDVFPLVSMWVFIYSF